MKSMLKTWNPDDPNDLFSGVSALPRGNRGPVIVGGLRCGDRVRLSGRTVVAARTARAVDAARRGAGAPLTPSQAWRRGL